MNLSLVSSITYGIFIFKRKNTTKCESLAWEVVRNIMQVLYLKIRGKHLLISNSSMIAIKTVLIFK